MAKISIIGFGNFGKLAAKHLSKVKNLEVFVTDILNKEKEAKEVGVKFLPLDEALKNKIIILAVPMEVFEKTILNIKNKISSGSLVLDFCSLKMFSSKIMKENLKNVEIIGTHPLFGPQSAPNSIKGMRIVLCNINAKKESFNKVKKLCEDLELKVIISTPEEHDKQMALSQALTHFIGKSLNNSNIKKIEMSTKTFEDLMDITEIIKNDSPALFNNMQSMNPFAKDIRKRFLKEAEKLDGEIDSLKDKE